jgi:hypothetical protein
VIKRVTYSLFEITRSRDLNVTKLGVDCGLAHRIEDPVNESAGEKKGDHPAADRQQRKRNASRLPHEISCREENGLTYSAE